MASNNDICSDALALVGKVKYVFGANDIKGGKGDCSSFTEYVYSINGIDIGRDTGAQYTKAKSIKKEDLKAGDLVFFKNTYSSGKIDGVSHVGIYLGDGQFVHNSSSKGVTVSDLNSDYYNSHWLGGGRISGVSYDGEVFQYDSTTDGNSSDSSGGSSIGLTWWGDIVKIIVVILLIVGAVVLIATSLGMNVHAGFIKGKSKKKTKTVKEKEVKTDGN